MISVQLTVLLLVVTCLGYGSTLHNHPRIVNPNPFLQIPPPASIEMVEYVLKNMAKNDSISEFGFYIMNLGTRMRSLMDIIFYSWDLYRKELALEKDGKTVMEANHELEESDSPDTTLHSESVGDDIQATTASETGSIYNGETLFPSGRSLKRFSRSKSTTVRPSSTHLADSTTASTSETKYTFVTNLKIDRGTPGVDYPDYADIPKTTFSCAEKIIPGFYADLETGCQVFHACWPDRRESLLCPVGTTFNQTLMKCDYWYNTNCSMAPMFFNVNTYFLIKRMDTGYSTSQNEYSSTSEATNQNETTNNPLHETKHPEKELSTEDWNNITDFLPIKAKVTVYSESSEHDAKPTSDVPQSSELKSKQVLLEQDKVRKVQVASRIVDGALSLAERVVKETAKMVMEIIKHRTKSEEKAQKAEAAAKIVDEATDLAAKVAKDTAQLVSKITLEAMIRKTERSADHVIPSKKLNSHVKEPSSTPKSTQQQSLSVNPKFVVKPFTEAVTSKQIQYLDSYGRKDVKGHVLEVIDRAFEIVLNVNVLPATRQAILENYVKFALSKKH